MFDICAMGEILIDAIAEPDTSVHITANAGGAPANVLACASQLGMKTAFIAKVGEDYIGKWLKSVLEKVGIHTGGLIMDRNRNTTIAMVSLDDKGDPSFSFYRNGCADVSLSRDEVNVDIIRQSRVFHFGSVSLTEEPSRSATLFAAAYARKQGLLVSYDPNLRRNLWEDEVQVRHYIQEGLRLCDVAKLADEECTFLYEEGDMQTIGQKILADYPNLKLLFITCGADGSFAFTREHAVYVPGFEVKAVDTTGAGDSLVGAILSQIVKQNLKMEGYTAEELQHMATYANGVGALVVRKYGAIPVMPSEAIVEAFLAERTAV